MAALRRREIAAAPALGGGPGKTEMARASQVMERYGVRHSWRAFWRVLPALPVLILPRVARGQRETFSNWNAWFILSGDVALDERWSILFDVSARRAGPIDEWQAAFARAGVAYAVAPRVRVALGAVRAESWPYGAVPGPYRAPEWRSWQQVVLSHELGRASLAHRYRLEQRWQGRRPNGGGGEEIDHWMRSSRFRYNVRATLPLVGTEVEPGEGYLTVSNELFISFGSNVQYVLFDQNRLTGAVGWRFSRAWRGELGFLEQSLLRDGGRQVERNHTITVSMSFTRPPPAGGARKRLVG